MLTIPEDFPAVMFSRNQGGKSASEKCHFQKLPQRARRCTTVYLDFDERAFGRTALLASARRLRAVIGSATRRGLQANPADSYHTSR